MPRNNQYPLDKPELQPHVAKDPETGGVDGEHYHYPEEVQPRADDPKATNPYAVTPEQEAEYKRIERMTDEEAFAFAHRVHISVDPEREALQVWHLNGLSSEHLDQAGRMFNQFSQRLDPKLSQSARDMVLFECAHALFDRITRL